MNLKIIIYFIMMAIMGITFYFHKINGIKEFKIAYISIMIGITLFQLSRLYENIPVEDFFIAVSTSIAIPICLAYLRMYINGKAVIRAEMYEALEKQKEEVVVNED